jgi:uncharacterized membrane protein (UPF0127 family)
MKIVNSSNKKIAADKIKVANNIISRFIGLLNRSNLEEGEGLLLTPCNSIHSFFMRFNFDVVFLAEFLDGIEGLFLGLGSSGWHPPRCWPSDCC